MRCVILVLQSMACFPDSCHFTADQSRTHLDFPATQRSVDLCGRDGAEDLSDLNRPWNTP